MSLPLEKQQRYTYEEYRAWDDDQLWELIDGVPYASPAPVRKHQDISVNLVGQFFNFLKGKPCKVYHPPFEVRLNIDTYGDTVVHPDLVIVCDESKLDDIGCKGAPDMVAEILSPSTARHDKLVKFNQYLKAGVREYWIVDPDKRTVAVHILENGKYTTTTYGEEDTVPVHVLEGCGIVLSDVFAL